eukprot:scaffold5420_cov301-Ochromonas_danica.AAC.1
MEKLESNEKELLRKSPLYRLHKSYESMKTKLKFTFPDASKHGIKPPTLSFYHWLGGIEKLINNYEKLVVHLDQQQSISDLDVEKVLSEKKWNKMYPLFSSDIECAKFWRKKDFHLHVYRKVVIWGIAFNSRGEDCREKEEFNSAKVIKQHK